MVSGHVTHRQLCCLELSPYSMEILRRGLDHVKTKETKTVSSVLLEGMEYLATIGMMVMMEMADINQRVDEDKQEVADMGKDVDELSAMRQEVMELGVELTEVRGEAEECQGVMMLMRNALTDAIRGFEDAKVEWVWERDLLIAISSGLLRCVEVVERQIGPGTVDHPIIIEDSKDSGNDGDAEMAPGDEISLWARDMAELVDNTLVGNQIVYDLVPIEELTRSD
jgi:hypothetical protein